MVKASKETDWADWVRRITLGHADAEAELFRRYKDGVAIIIRAIVHSEFVTEDLSQDTFRISLEKIRRGDVREPEKLSGFICSVARNIAIEYVRKRRRLAYQEEIGNAEHIRDPQPDPLEHLLRKERADIVLQVLSEIRVKRDREVLYRYYIAEEDKDRICADLGLSSRQFNSINFRALKRYKELYMKLIGKN
ncbi:MAG: sigma-70 family RNA polymerase sigma factor [Blastocatellia bacterium]